MQPHLPVTGIGKTKPPPSQASYVLFVWLWDLTRDSPADLVVSHLDRLDEYLLSACDSNPDNWLVSPHGAAALFDNVSKAIDSSAKLVQILRSTSISAAITVGRLEGIYQLRRWNFVGPAINVAARIASFAPIRGRVAVAPEIAEQARMTALQFKDIFAEMQSGRVKNTNFRYHLVEVAQDQHKAAATHTSISAPHSAITTSEADIVAFDIEKYSQKPAQEQTRLSRDFAGIVEEIGTLSDHKLYEPAGDGGSAVFYARESSQSADSSYIAMVFAEQLRQYAEQAGIRIRIGIARGSVAKSKYRYAVGGSILLANHICSLSKVGGIAVSQAFWELLPN